MNRIPPIGSRGWSLSWYMQMRRHALCLGQSGEPPCTLQYELMTGMRRLRVAMAHDARGVPADVSYFFPLASLCSIQLLENHPDPCLWTGWF